VGKNRPHQKSGRRKKKGFGKKRSGHSVKRLSKSSAYTHQRERVAGSLRMGTTEAAYLR